jgi:hypothetical protein
MKSSHPVVVGRGLRSGWEASEAEVDVAVKRKVFGHIESAL